MTLFDRLAESLAAPLDAAGRVLIAVLFVVAGFGKIGGYEGTQAYMASQGVPGALLPLVILLELGGGLAIVVGLLVRPIALALAGFSIASALLFHAAFDDPGERIQFMKNLAIAGGFLFLFLRGPGPWSVDAVLLRRRTGGAAG